jgi:hypothetical protein
MEKESKATHARVIEFLSKVVPGIKDVTVKNAGKKETLEFRQLVGSNKEAWRFMAENMSDGTLRALGVLTALFQSSRTAPKAVSFVGIEEPEMAIHPGAAGVLLDALLAASKVTQVAVTSHSPELVDDKNLPDSSILAVVSRSGETRIGPLDEAGRSAIRERLYTAGELLRLNQIEPDDSAITEISPKQLDLFADFISCQEWLSNKMISERIYSETTDQPALTVEFDMDSARCAGSFDKCFRDVQNLISRASLLKDNDPYGRLT